MSRSSFIAIVFMISLTGCSQVGTQVRTVNLDDPYAELSIAETSTQWASIAEINKRARHQEALINLTDERLITARNLQVTPDSTSWFDAETSQLVSVATREVETIKFLKGKIRDDHLFVGVFAGAAVGALVGYLMGDHTYESCRGFIFQTCRDKVFHAELKASIGGMLGGFLGGVLVAKRMKYYYHIEKPLPVPLLVTKKALQ